MKAMILAAGFGTRFRPVTYEIPKPMIPLCNRPLIDYAVDSLLAAGVRDIVVNLHHLPAAIESHLRAEYSGRCDFHFSFEPEILGTGGGVRKVRSILEGDRGFFLVNGDTVQFAPLGRLQSALEESDAIAALLLRHLPLDDRYTKVYFDGTYVTGFREGVGEAMMFSGSHALSTRIFDYVPDRAFSGMTEDVYVPLLRDGRERLAGSVDDGLWFDIGTPLRYIAATHAMREEIVSGALPPGRGSVASAGSLVHASASIDGTMMESVAGAESAVAAGARVNRSALWRGVRVERGAEIDASILAGEIRIPAESTIRNAMVSWRHDDMIALPGLRIAGDLAAVPVDPDSELVFDVR